MEQSIYSAIWANQKNVGGSLLEATRRVRRFEWKERNQEKEAGNFEQADQGNKILGVDMVTTLIEYSIKYGKRCF